MVNESLLEKDNDVFEESHRANETNKFEEQQKRIGFNNAVVSYMESFRQARNFEFF